MPVKKMSLAPLQAMLKDHIKLLENASVKSGGLKVKKEDVKATVDAMEALQTRAAVVCQQGLLAIEVDNP